MSLGSMGVLKKLQLFFQLNLENIALGIKGTILLVPGDVIEKQEGGRER